MAYTADDLTAIDAAISSGVRRVRFADGRETQWQDVNQMLLARQVIRTDIDLAARAASGITRTRFATFGSGL